LEELKSIVPMVQRYRIAWTDSAVWIDGNYYQLSNKVIGLMSWVAAMNSWLCNF